MKRWILGIVTVIALAGGAATASAQGYGGYGCGPGYNVGYGGYSPGYNLNSPGYGGGYTAGYGGYGLGYGGVTHSRRSGHYDYHPSTVHIHRGHLEYSSGHYDRHQSAHRRW